MSEIAEAVKAYLEEQGIVMSEAWPTEFWTSFDLTYAVVLLWNDEDYVTITIDIQPDIDIPLTDPDSLPKIVNILREASNKYYSGKAKAVSAYKLRPAQTKSNNFVKIAKVRRA
jgi:hypothetical protein